MCFWSRSDQTERYPSALAASQKETKSASSGRYIFNHMRTTAYLIARKKNQENPTYSFRRLAKSKRRNRNAPKVELKLIGSSMAIGSRTAFEWNGLANDVTGVWWIRSLVCRCEE